MPTGNISVQEESNGRRVHLSGDEKSQGKLRGVGGWYNGNILTSPPHGEVPRGSLAIDKRSKFQGRRFGDLCGVLYVDPEVGVMPSERMSGKGKKPRETSGAT